MPTPSFPLPLSELYSLSRRQWMKSWEAESAPITLKAGTTAVTDSVASGGNAIRRLSTAASADMWDSEVISPPGFGEYVVYFRLKVSDRSSTSRIITLALYDVTAAANLATLDLAPSDFAANNTYEFFAIRASFRGDRTYKFRGNSFVTALADLYLDWIGTLDAPIPYATQSSTLTAHSGVTLSVHSGVTPSVHSGVAAVASRPTWESVATYTSTFVVSAALTLTQNIFVSSLSGYEVLAECGLGLQNTESDTTADISFFFYFLQDNVVTKQVGLPMSHWVEKGVGAYPIRLLLQEDAGSNSTAIQIWAKNVDPLLDVGLQYNVKVTKKGSHTHTMAQPESHITSGPVSHDISGPAAHVISGFAHKH